MTPTNYFKITERSYYLHNRQQVETARIIALYSFDDADENTIKEAYERAVLKLRKLVDGDLGNVRHDPKCPFRLTTWRPITVQDFRRYRLLSRD